MFRRAFLITALATAAVPVGLGIASISVGGEAGRTLGVVALAFVFMPFLWLVLALVLGRLDPPQKQVESWLPGVATVAAVEVTMSRVGANPVLKYTLAVEGPSASQVAVRQLTPARFLPFLRVGTRLPVATDPERPQRVAIDWKRAAEVLDRASAPPPDLSG